MSGEQFAPYEPPYMKRWREGLDAKPVKVAKVKHKSRKKAKKRAKK